MQRTRREIAPKVVQRTRRWRVHGFERRVWRVRVLILQESRVRIRACSVVLFNYILTSIQEMKKGRNRHFFHTHSLFFFVFDSTRGIKQDRTSERAEPPVAFSTCDRAVIACIFDEFRTQKKKRRRRTKIVNRTPCRRLNRKTTWCRPCKSSNTSR